MAGQPTIKAITPTRPRTGWRMRPRWARPDHPVYRLESNRRVGSRVLQTLHSGCLPAILAVAGLAVTGVITGIAADQLNWDVEGAMMSGLGILLLLVVVIQVLAGAASNILVVAQTTPLISGEVELQSWGLLRATTLTLKEIVLAKYAATLATMRSTLTGLVILRLVSTVTGLLFLAYLLFRETYYYDREGWYRVIERRLWVAPVIAGTIFLAWYAAQPFIQFLLNGALGMAASALARSRGRAVATGLGARLVGWVGSITINAGLIYLLGYLIIENWADPAYAPIRAFRRLNTPSDELVGLVVSLTIAVYMLAVLAVQVGAILLALRLAQRRARHLGG